MEEQIERKPNRWPVVVVILVLLIGALPVYALLRREPLRFHLLEKATLISTSHEVLSPNSAVVVTFYKVPGTYEQVASAAMAEMKAQGGWTPENRYDDPQSKGLASPDKKWETHLAREEGIEILNCFPESWTPVERGITWDPSMTRMLPGHTVLVHVHKDYGAVGLIPKLKAAIKRMFGRP